MVKHMTRANAIQVWFAAVVLVVVAVLALGTHVTVGTGGMLLALSLVPALIVFWLWPGPESVTAGDVLRGTDRRE